MTDTYKIYDALRKCKIWRGRIFLLFLIFIFAAKQGASQNFRTTKARYMRVMENEWETICLPFNVDVRSDDDFTLYKFNSIDNGKAIFEPYPIGTVVLAGTPCLIRKKGNPYLSIVRDNTDVHPIGTNDYRIGVWSMKGTYDKRTVNDDNSFYVSSNNVCRKQEDASMTIKPFCAWLECEDLQSIGTQMIQIGILGDGTLNVQSIMSSNNCNYGIYNAVGNRTQSLRKGVNIIVSDKGTKKIFIK